MFTGSCAAGEQPTSNNENCELCPIGYYNPDEGLTSCTACDAGLVTLELGSTDSSACQEIVMLPDADLVYGNGDCVTDVYDSAYRRSEEHTSELQSHSDLVCRLLLEKKKKKNKNSSYCYCVTTTIEFETVHSLFEHTL